ncbi:hypothetical protein EYZ11_003310 [Aspergillus tanneri]|uniref:Amine oxidase domain-containing protein n=1 Tax=Aspergillus tanneri TaxID=1220188 RepID=A0A4S3JTM7_9EURO|nr:hypothetical protein EYZ11_003310 [Aspergillus tanneri]
MVSFVKSVLLLIVVGVAVAISSEDEQEIITRDVCIIGGGSSGTYTAIQLHDAGKSVVVVEKEDALGGHTNTYIDPATNLTVDYGVIIFHDLDIVKTYFNRLGVAFKKASTLSSASSFVDIKTGEAVPTYIPPDPTNALIAYGLQAAKYPELEAGFYLPNLVPNDLLMPFGDFVAKYNLGDAVPTVASFGQGLGDILNLQTLYVFKNFGLDVLHNLQVGFLDTVGNDNHKIYDKAQQVLGSDVLLQSKVISTDRSADNHLKVIVSGPSGTKTIHAGKLLISIPPKLENLHSFDLDERERHLFSLKNITSIQNIDPDTPYNLPQLPGLYGISATAIPGLYDVKYGSPIGLPDEVIKADIIASIKRLQKTGIATSEEEPKFVAFKSHAPFELTVSTDEIKSGFYTKLYALQGHRNTFYTGAAFHTQDSSLLWQFSEALLPRLKN